MAAFAAFGAAPSAQAAPPASPNAVSTGGWASADEPTQAHLLDRVTWGCTGQGVQALGGLSISAYLTSQLRPGANAPLPREAQAQIDVMAISRTPIEALAADMEARHRAAKALPTVDERKAALKTWQQDMRALQQEAAARFVLRALYSPTQLREKMTWFWMNHFNVFAGKGNLRALVGDYEERAIRPHALGRFRDLLGATAHHPAMLVYLDNARNGAGRINENYARELLQLFSIGVEGGYTQGDVVEFARAITGWGLAAPQAPGREVFAFRAAAHQPGARQVLHRRFGQEGEQQGVAILHMLAVHPATARHVSLQLARHFIADAPPPTLVQRMAKAWLDSEGHLPTVYRAMLDDDAAWQPDARKFKTPDDFCVSALRACGLSGQDVLAMAVRLQAQLGQPVFQPRSPAGFGDVAADWGGPDALFKRVQAAQAIAERLPDSQGITPLALGGMALGSGLDAQTAAALRRAESVQQGVALLLASPAFQWRS